MVYIDEEGNLADISGSIEEICGNCGALWSMVMKHIVEHAKSAEGCVALIEALMEATIRTTLELVEDGRYEEGVIRACRTLGATGSIDRTAYKIKVEEGRGGIVS